MDVGTKCCSARKTERPLDAFWCDRSRLDGRSYVCLSCRREKAKKSYVPRTADHYLGYAAEHHYAIQAVCTVCHHAREGRPVKGRTSLGRFAATQEVM